MKDTEKAQEVLEFQRRSQDWLQASYYDQWEQVIKNYKAEVDPGVDPNDVTPNDGRLYDAYSRPVNRRTDYERSAVGMPDTFAMNRRATARYTAQVPDLRIRGTDQDWADRTSRSLMYQWDKGGNQRFQKKHVSQALLFGWSVKAWYWEDGLTDRFKRVNPMEDGFWESPDGEITKRMYQEEYAQYAQESADLLGQPDNDIIAAKLLANHSRGNLLPIRYNYQGYSGPKSDVLFIGDCFPEPNFGSLQQSNWFIVQRSRKRSWLENLAKTFKKENPAIAKNIAKLLTDKKYGTARRSASRDSDALFRRMQSAIDRTTDTGESQKSKADAEWVITECHYTGSNARISYACDTAWLGTISYPYELDGQVAFTELIFIDDLLSGIGDSTARIMRGLQEIKNKQVNARADLIYSVLRPLIWTTNQHLYENPDLLKRHKGMRLVKVQYPNELGVLGEQAALAAAAAGTNDESSIMRNFQLGSGESNMSMGANVDPQQGRTATGAKIIAYNQDVLSKSDIEMLNFAVKADAEIMFQLNRSERADPQSLSYSLTGDRSMVTVVPMDYQQDGEIEPEIGSTLADDDESKVQKAQTIWSTVMSNPAVFNVQKAAEEVLRSLGMGKRIPEWMAPPPPPPPPPPPRVSISMSAKLEDVENPEDQQMILDAFKAGLPPPQQDQAKPNPNTPPLGQENAGPESAMAAAEGGMNAG